MMGTLVGDAESGRVPRTSELGPIATGLKNLWVSTGAGRAHEQIKKFHFDLSI